MIKRLLFIGIMFLYASSISIADQNSNIRILWRENEGADIALNEAYLKKAPDSIRAILGYISAQAGTEGWWDNDEPNKDMSNLKCKLTSALRLGYQGGSKHKSFIHHWFRKDPKLANFEDFCTVPYTATIQDTFSYINMKLEGDVVTVDYKISSSNSRDGEGGADQIKDKYKIYKDYVVRVSHDIVKREKY